MYDLQGQVVLEVIHENQTSGFYTKKIDKGHLKPGIYFYGIQAVNNIGNTKEFGKMIIL